MTVTLELKPEIEARARQIALAQGRRMEEILASAIETGLPNDTDERFALMREAVHDKLFMADLAEVMDDFKYVDAE